MLKSLGLKENEVRLYQAVVKAGDVTPSALAKLVGIKRTTAYSLVRGLSEKGLLVEDATRRPRKIRGASADEVRSLISDEVELLKIRERALVNLADELSRLAAESFYPVPHIRFIEEHRLDKFLYHEMPAWFESMLKVEPTFWGFQDQTFVEHYRKWIDWQWRHAPKTIDLKLLSNQSPVERSLSGKYPRRHIKFWGKTGNFASSTWVMGEYVVIVNTRQRPFYLVEIQSESLAHDLREIFKNLWSMV